MTVATFPRPYPQTDKVFIESEFVLNRRQAPGVLGSGRDFVIDRGQPTWKLTLKTKPLFAAELGLWTSWRDSLRGGGRFFLGFDPDHEYPMAYMPRGWGALTRAGGGAFDGTATVTAIAASGLPDVGRDVLHLATLPVGLQLGAGDQVSLKDASGRVSLHRILDADGVVASGAGAATVWVEPEIPAAFDTASIANLFRPCGKFRLLSFTAPSLAKSRNRPGQASFTALSTLLPDP